MLSADSFFQIRHLDRCQSRLETLVAALQAGTIDGLLQSIAGENTEGMRDSGFLRRLTDTPRDFVGDDIIVRGVAPQKTAETNNRIVVARFG